MKKIFLSLLALGTLTASYAQSDYKKQPQIGVSFILNDFQTATDLRAGGLANVIKAKQWSKTKRMSPGMAVTYVEGLCSHVDFVGSLAGSFVEYPVPNKPTTNNNALLLEASATANLKLVSDNYYFNPFVTLGVGASKFKGYYGGFIPAGVGVQLRIMDGIFVLVNSQYRIPVTENVAYHLYHSFGIVANLKKKEAIKGLPQ